MSIKSYIKKAVALEQEIELLKESIEQQREQLKKTQECLEDSFTRQEKLYEKSYSIDCQLFVEELAKLWNVSVEELEIQALTNVFMKNASSMSEMQLVQRLHFASGAGNLRLIVCAKDDDQKRLKFVNQLNLNSIQKDGKTTKEHLVLVEDESYGRGFKFDDYRKMILERKFVNSPTIDENGNVKFENILDQACYNAVIASEKSVEEEVQTEY